MASVVYRVGHTSLFYLGPLVCEGVVGVENFILGSVSFPFQKGSDSTLREIGFPLISCDPASQAEVSTCPRKVVSSWNLLSPEAMAAQGWG